MAKGRAWMRGSRRGFIGLRRGRGDYDDEDNDRKFKFRSDASRRTRQGEGTRRDRITYPATIWVFNCDTDNAKRTGQFSRCAQAVQN